jgi:hypothetical protein
MLCGSSLRSALASQFQLLVQMQPPGLVRCLPYSFIDTILTNCVGYLKLQPSDHLFMRDRDGDLNPLNDVICHWTVPL